MAGKYYSLSPYNYCAGNPGNVVDPDGSIIGTVFDAVSLVTGVKSFVSNVKQGKVGAAIVDGIGIVADAAALATPFASAGAGMAIKAVRGVDKVADTAKAAKAADNVADAAKAINTADNAADATKGLNKGISVETTSRAARREAMREAGIPTSQQPVSQSKNSSGREYRYDTPSSLNGNRQHTVQEQTKDRNHNSPHWEAGEVKQQGGEPAYNKYDRPIIKNGTKSKVYYGF